MPAERAARWVGLGAMRLSTGRAPLEEEAARAVLRAAIDAGVNVINTARSYAQSDADLGANERLVGRALRECLAGDHVRVATKVGMRRPKGRWVPDGRRKTILAQAEASAEALGRVPDLVLLHAHDPKTPLATSARALRAVVDRGLARGVGLSNVRLGELLAARELAPIEVVELAISPLEEEAVRGGVVERCLADGLVVLAHSPLGGPKPSRRLAKDPVLRAIAEAHGVTPGTIALALLYGLHARLVPIPGATRTETARAAAEAARLELGADETGRLDERFAVGRLLRTPRIERRVMSGRAEVVLVMGLPAAGKSTLASELSSAPAGLPSVPGLPLEPAGSTEPAGTSELTLAPERLNRDERGGTLAALTDLLEERLRAGVPRVVMDNTYPSRARRDRVLDTAWRCGASVRCVHVETSLGDAQINAVDRMLERHGELLGPEAIARASKDHPNTFGPRAQFRYLDHFEAPSLDEGFTAIERVPFERAPAAGHDQAGVVADTSRLGDTALSGRPGLALAWRPEASEEELAELRASLPAGWELGLCVHPAGPPICWCRRPMPGLVVEWLRREHLDPMRCVYLGASAADATLAERLGIPYVAPS